MQPYKAKKMATALVLSTGLALPLYQFLHNRSLWLDEAMLALNILAKDYRELLLPLDDHQVAPILFLWIEKWFVTVIHPAEYGLRVFPLFCYFLSLFFFWRLTRLLFKEQLTIVFALSLFVCSNALLYYSSEVKQYMCDVLMTTSIYFFTLKPYERKENRYYILAITGSIFLFLSNVAPIILFSCGAYLCYQNLSSRSGDAKYLTGLIGVWGTIFLWYYFNFINDHPTQSIMVAYWSDANGFMPLNPVSGAFFHFLSTKTGEIFIDFFQLGYWSKWGLPLLSLLGCIHLSSKKNLAALLITPFILHLLLSGFRLYPFHSRLILYLCPLTILIITMGFDLVQKIAAQHFGSSIQMGITIAFLLLIAQSFLARPFPIEKEEIKRSIDFIKKHAEDADQLYVFYGASKAFQFYQNTEYIKIDLPATIGGEHRKDRAAYLRELAPLNGRYWLLFSHDILQEETYIVEELEAFGEHQLKKFQTRGSSTYLFKSDE